MPLPKISYPLNKLTLPSNGKNVLVRPFTTKEEKILLMAKEAEDVNQMLLALKQIIGNCLQDYDVEDLAILDIEYIFVKLRAQSVDNNVEFVILDPDTKEEIKLELDLNDLKISTPKDFDTKIPVSDDMFIVMRYPGWKELEVILNHGLGNKLEMFKMMMSCMDSVVQGDEVFKINEQTEDELEEFVESLTNETVNKIKGFFEKLPTIRHEIEYENSQGKSKTFVIEGLRSFFT